MDSAHSRSFWIMIAAVIISGIPGSGVLFATSSP